ncbi:hypothetical protein CBS147482_2651 [Aspergillus niger]|nr:hypothetical protein CBS147482_2651 [Aspergillus niger]
MRIAENNVQPNWVRISVSCTRCRDNAVSESLFRLLGPGDRVVVWARAQYPGWNNVVKEIQFSISTSAMQTTHNSRENGQRLSGNSKRLPEDNINQSVREGAPPQPDLDNAAHASVVEAPEHVTKPPTQEKEECTQESTLPDSDMTSGCDKKVVVSIDSFTDGLEKDLSNIPVDDPGRADLLVKGASQFFILFHQYRRLTDIDKALAYYQEAVMLKPERPEIRVLLASALSMKLCVTSDDQCLPLAITQLERTTQIKGDWPWRQVSLRLLASLYAARHSRTGSEEDLQGTRRLIATLGQADPISSVIEHTLFENIFKASDDKMVGEEALDKTIKLLDQAADSDPARRMLLYLLHIQRGQRTGNTRDIDFAISELQGLYDDLPEDVVHEGVAEGRRRLSSYLIRKWQRTNSPEDALKALKEIIKGYRAALPGSELKTRFLAHICTILMGLEAPKRPDQILKMINLLENLEIRCNDRLSIDAKTDIRSSRAALCKILYSSTGELTYLEKTISLYEELLGEYSHKSSGLNVLLQNLAITWVKKAIHTQENAAWMQALQYALQPCASEEVYSINRVQCATTIVYCALRLEEWEWACDTADGIFPLLPSISGRDLEQDDRIRGIRTISNFTSNVCTAYINAMKAFGALTKLEQGRGIMMGDLFDSQSDLTALQQASPDLAREYETHRNRAFHRIGVDETKRGSPNERRDAFQKLRHCELRIREMAGFETFLQSMTSHEICQCSSEGPIIIVNISDFASDAIVVVPSGPICLRLNDMKATSVPPFREYLMRNGGMYPSGRDLENDISQKEFDYRDMLAWLWYTCVKHILDTLAFYQKISTSGQKTRVWWIGAGSASGLPFHAAGDYRGDQPNEDENCLARVISSYIPTIKTLRNARARATQAMHRAAAADKLSLLIATMPDTPGHGTLSGVLQESQRITDVVGQAMNVRHMVEPSSEGVLNQLQHAELVHFACHGHSDPHDPLKSHLLLKKDTAEFGEVVDKLTVSKLLETQAMSRAWIAYLSACSTAEIRDKSLRNEGLHITSGFLIAGFSHIIGSIWPADDQISADMAAYFYEAFVARRATAADPNRAVAEAVHDATLRIRKKYAYEPLAWASYTHVGV